ncbi:MAG: hypothetical protein AAB593_00950 [Patescibacteria group bacterium]
MLRKIIIIAIFSVVILLPAISFGAEQYCREVPLPKLPGLPKDFQGPCVGPAEYIIYWFYFSIYLAGLLAFFAIVAAGVIRLFSMGQPSMIQKSNKIITNAGLGIILLFGSFLILNIINPSLTIVSNPSLNIVCANIEEKYKSDIGGKCRELICRESEQCKNGGNEIGKLKCAQDVCKKVVGKGEICSNNSLNTCVEDLFCFGGKCAGSSKVGDLCYIIKNKTNCEKGLLCVVAGNEIILSTMSKIMKCTDGKTGSPCQRNSHCANSDNKDCKYNYTCS